MYVRVYIYIHRHTHIYTYPYIEESLHRGTLVKGYPYKCLCVWIPPYMYVSVPYVYILVSLYIGDALPFYIAPMHRGILTYRGTLIYAYPYR